MNFLTQNPHETSNVNSSMNSSTSHSQAPPAHISNEGHHFPYQQRPLPPIPNYESQGGPRSNYSSINNILPCTDSRSSTFKAKRDEYCIKSSEGTPFSSVTFQETSTKNTPVLSFRQKTSLENSLNGIERISSRNQSRPPLNPNDVSRGISALHHKVDELLRKTSQARRKSINEGERSQRAVSTDSHPQNNPINIFPLNGLQPETPGVAIIQGGLLIDLSSNRHQDLSQFSSVKTDARDSTPQAQVRSLRAPASPYQDLFLKDKPWEGTPKGPTSPRSANKDAGRSSCRVEMARNYTDIRYVRRQEQTPSSANKSYSKEFSEIKKDGTKPKYDENKLEAILSRIKERNSVSPAPRQRSSVTLQETGTPLGANSGNAKAFWSTSKKNDELYIGRQELRTEERTSVVPINWQYDHIAYEEKSIEEIPNEKDVNITGNTTILEILDKKKSLNNVKSHYAQSEDENGKKNATRPINVVLGERKLRIVAPKATGKSSAAGAQTIYLQDILKDLQIDKPLKIKESTKERAEIPSKGEAVLEKSKDAIVNKKDFELKETSVNVYGMTMKQNEEGIKVRRVETEPSQYYSGESSYVPKQVLDNVGSVKFYNSHQQNGIREKSLDRCQERFEDRIKPKDSIQSISKLNLEKVKGFESEKKPERIQQGNTQTIGNPMLDQSPIKKAAEDSLELDDSVFSVKEGGVNTHRQINLNVSQDKDPKNNQRNKLDTTVIRNRFLQEEGDLSDFDFDRNRLDTTELERSRISLGGLIKFEDNYLENLGVKQPKISEGRTQPLGLSERILPKSEAPKNGILNRAK